jgi:D-alanyl-D-alanine carboxypeptidase (penicillin-binding protein 5/6)
MKSISTLLFLAVCSLCLSETTVRAQDAEAYAVADGITGHVLQGERTTRKLQIGSLTKIATAMVVLDWADLYKQDIGTLATVPPDALTVGGLNSVGFQPGDQVSLRDLLYAALLQSDNVAAYTLADHVGRTLKQDGDERSTDVFVAQMNALARKLGMRRTKFLNPHGLDSDERPYSTAQDLVLLTSYAMNRSGFRFFVSQNSRRITRHLASGGVTECSLANTNELLGTHSIDGVKTGKTVRAGDCVVISATRAPESVQNADGSFTVTPRRLIVVVLGARNRFSTALGLLNNGWNLYDEWAAAGRPLGKN